MIVLTNCLSKTVDEGALKVANSFVKRIKGRNPSAVVVSYDRLSELSDVHLKLNKLLLNRKLFSFLKKKDENVLYIPFPAREWATALRVFILSRFCRKRLFVFLVMQCRLGLLGRLLFRMSGAEFLALSQEAFQLYSSMVGADRVRYFKTGVDTKKFVPVSKDEAVAIKRKYGFDPEKKLILHVGHLNNGRNVGELTKISDEYSVLLVVSTLTQNEQDLELKTRLLERSNVRIIESYLPNIQEIYGMADVYFFPVQSFGHCIDVPLSCLEAASCNKPIVTTDYGEMKAFQGKEGFYFIESFEEAALNDLIDQALRNRSCDTRSAVLEYDWEHAVSDFNEM